MRITRYFLTAAILAAGMTGQACTPITEPEPPPTVTAQSVDYTFATYTDDMVFPRGLLRITKDSVINVRSDSTVRTVVKMGADSTISFVLDIGSFSGRMDATGYIFGEYSNGYHGGKWFAAPSKPT